LPAAGMHRFMVNMKTARIFKGIPESWNLGKSAEKFAKMRQLETGGGAIIQARIYHVAALTALYLALTNNRPLDRLAAVNVIVNRLLGVGRNFPIRFTANRHDYSRLSDLDASRFACS